MYPAKAKRTKVVKVQPVRGVLFGGVDYHFNRGRCECLYWINKRSVYTNVLPI